jgi:hypothetical protein
MRSGVRRRSLLPADLSGIGSSAETGLGYGRKVCESWLHGGGQLKIGLHN